MAAYERIAREQGGFFYPWRSQLEAGNGEVAYTELVSAHLSPDRDVLEAGCGHGTDALRFAPRVRTLRAWYAVEGFIAAARDSAARAGLTNSSSIR